MNLTAHQPHQFPADGQPQPGTTITAGGIGRCLGETLEKLRLLVLGQANASIGHRKGEQRRFTAVTAAHQRQYNPPIAGEFHCIANQVDEDLAQPDRIPHHIRRGVRIHIQNHQGTVITGRQIEHLHTFRQQRRQIKALFDQLQFAGFNFGKIQHVVDQRRQGSASAINQADIFLLPWRRVGLAQQFRQTDHTVQWRPDFVTHAGQEQAFRLALGTGIDRPGIGPVHPQRQPQHQHIQQHNPQHHPDRGPGLLLASIAEQLVRQ